jgi:hypothetical protein
VPGVLRGVAPRPGVAAVPKNYKPKLCDVCGKEFVPISGIAKRCGEACAKEYDRNRRQTPEYKETERRRRQTTEYKESGRNRYHKRKQTTEYKEYVRKLRQTTEYKEYVRKLRQTTEYKESGLLRRRKSRQKNNHQLALMRLALVTAQLEDFT